MKCPNCDADMPDKANFCTKCGSKLDAPVVEQNQSEQTTTVQQMPIDRKSVEQTQQSVLTEQPQPKQSSFDTKKFFGFLSERFVSIYVIVGLIAAVLMEFSQLFIFAVYWFGILLGIFAILFALAFLLLGIFRYCALKPQNGKRTNADIIYFAVAIIGFVFVLVTTFIVMVAGVGLQKMF